MVTYPTKTTEFGNYIQYYDKLDRIEELKGLLYQQYQETKKEVERHREKVFCKFSDFKWIERSHDSFGDPLLCVHSIGWKCKATGRAFYIDRLQKYGKIYERHPNRKCVPKRKRGKFNWKKWKYGIKNG